MGKNVADEDRFKHYEILELLARLADHKGVIYEVDEIKDGKIFSIKNVRIERIVLRPI